MCFIWWIQLSIIGVIIKLQIITKFGQKIDDTDLLVPSKLLILLRVFQTGPSSSHQSNNLIRKLNGLGWAGLDWPSFPKQYTRQRFFFLINLPICEKKSGTPTQFRGQVPKHHTFFPVTCMLIEIQQKSQKKNTDWKLKGVILI